jgi:hypothetical protein
MVRVVHPRGPRERTERPSVNKAIDSRLVTLPLGQVYLVPKNRVLPADQAQKELSLYRDENYVNRTRMWV